MKVLKSARGLFASSGLPSANTANADCESAQQEEETGVWHYLIVDPSGVRPRETPNYEGKKIGKLARYNEGQVITVERRRKSGWTKWVYCKDVGGWVFDVSPKKDRKVRMVEVECIKGEWSYEATSDMAAVMPGVSPLLVSRFASGAAKPATCLRLGEVVQISERVRPLTGKGSFLKLADGRGYVVDFMDGKQMMRRSMSNPQSDTTPNASPPLSNSPSVTDVKPTATGGAVEYGDWTYVIVDPKGVCPRNAPTYDKASKTDRRVEEGEIVRVSERRAAEGTTFLKISSPAGWIFDTQPTNKARVRAAEVNIERGNFPYRIVAEKGVALRSRCSFADASKVGRGPERGALVDVKERIRIGETTFLKLQCGLQHGWVFDKKNKRNLVEELGPKEVKEVELEGTVKETTDSGVHLRLSPTMDKWALTKMLLLENSRVQVNKSANLENKEWLQVSMPGRNMQGWVLAEAITVDQVVTSRPSQNQPWKMATPAPEKMYEMQKARQNTLQYRVLGSTSNPQCV
eukprot:gnl/MRDRNA2_/MRDRNA2_93736_c0_seq1.p1 gnl/MRDRNA2_/MRDRNA2_93736_c0~~gnl/MRDRNA2_/MRDRNA2_93736_c0_seq1.p1  ORF type:complete len:518 (+),score=113.80 gnl/MRDRNA2_/MRDRNA2_93736_c0_seq1:138-1691(+)